MANSAHSCTNPNDDLFNPATGLPMVNGEFGGVDVAGNPFGLDLHSCGLSDTTPAFDTGGFFSSMGIGSPWD